MYLSVYLDIDLKNQYSLDALHLRSNMILFLTFVKCTKLYVMFSKTVSLGFVYHSACPFFFLLVSAVTAFFVCFSAVEIFFFYPVRRMH